jgi:glutamate synthase (NADPH/NADH) large chain
MALFGYSSSVKKLFLEARATRRATFAAKPKSVFDYLKLRRIISEGKINPEEVELIANAANGPAAVKIDHPIMTYEEMDAVKGLNSSTRRAKLLDTTMGFEMDLKQRLLQIAFDAKSAVEDGFSFLALSDRKTSDKRLQVPSILACGAVHRMLSMRKMRSGVGIFVETGEATRVHHFACLYACGANGVHPFLAQECLVDEVAGGKLRESAESLVEKYRETLEGGLKALIARKGYQSLSSFKESRKLDANGLASELVELCLPDTSAKMPSNGFPEIKAALLAMRARG